MNMRWNGNILNGLSGLVLTVFLCIMVVAAATTVGAAAASTPADTTTSAAAAETIAWWNGLETENQRLGKYLQETYAQIERQMGIGNANTSKAFADFLNSSLPGSSVTPHRYGRIFYNGVLYSFNDRWQISNAEKKSGPITEQYYFTQPERYVVSDGVNTVTVNRPKTPDSLYINATIPAIAVDAGNAMLNRSFQGKTYRFGGGVYVTVSSPEGVVFTDTYRSTDVGASADKFSLAVLTNPAYRSTVLSAASQLYAQNVSLVGVSGSSAAASSVLANAVQSQVSRFKSQVVGLGVILGFFMYLVYVTLRQLNKSSRRRHYHTAAGTSSYNIPPIPRSSSWTSSQQKEASNNTPMHYNWDVSLLSLMEWKRFETVCEEFYRLKGYRAVATSTGADGGVDIRLYKDSTAAGQETTLVQCKHWRSKKVGVEIVRAMQGVLVHEVAEHGIIVITGDFSNEAKEFAVGKNITLISGSDLIRQILELPQVDQSDLLKIATDGDFTTPTCPQCDVKMVKRNTYYAFWGCPNYPRCKSKIYINKKLG